MDIRKVNISQDGPWENIHQHILSLYMKYVKSYELQSHSIFPSLHKLSFARLLEKDSSFLLALVKTEDGERIAGFAITTNYGQDIGLIIVHPLYRNLGIGTRLLTKQLAELGTICYHVPIFNKAAVKMCFNAGLIATEMSSYSKHYSFLIMKSPYSNFDVATTVQ